MIAALIIITKADATLYSAKIRVTSLRMANRNPDFKMHVGSTETTVRSVACAVTFRLGISPVVYAVTQRHKTGAVSVRYNTNIAFWGLPLPLHSFLHCLSRNRYRYDIHGIPPTATKRHHSTRIPPCMCWGCGASKAPTCGFEPPLPLFLFSWHLTGATCFFLSSCASCLSCVCATVWAR